MTSTSDEVGHTATPWFVDGDGVNRLIRGADQTIVAKRHRLPREIHSANFSLIVRACNSHDSLVKALEEQAHFLRGLAIVMNGWAKTSQDYGWSTHQVEVNKAQAKICTDHAVRIDVALSQAKGGK